MPTGPDAQQERRFQIAFDASPTAMLMVDRRGTIVLANAEAERLFGYTRSELVGGALLRLVPERFRSGHPGFRQAFFAEPSSRAMGAGRDLFAVRKDGTEVPVEIGLNPIETDEGSFVRSSIVDISERKQAAARFRIAVEASPSGVVMVDAQGAIVLANAETARMFGYAESELIGLSVDELVPSRHAVGHRELRVGYMADPTVRSMGAGRDLHGRRKDGTEFPVEVGLNPIETSDGRLVLSTIVDITQRKRTERELEQKRAALARSNADLSEFASAVSHDLRTPLDGVRTLAQFILEDNAGKLPSRSDRHLQQMTQRIERLSRLLESLLEYARANTGAGARTPVDLAAMIDEIRQLLDPPAGFRIVVEGELPAIETDRTPLMQVVQNLVNNAIKHHDRQEGIVTITGRDLGASIELSVRDDGPGIEPQYREQIFGLFQQLQPRDRVEGSGMGLALVKKIVARRGGTIRITDNADRGVTFVFTWAR